MSGRGYLRLKIGVSPGITDPLTLLSVTTNFGSGQSFLVNDTVPIAPFPLSVRPATFFQNTGFDIEHFPVVPGSEPLDVDPTEYDPTRFFDVVRAPSAYQFDITVDYFIRTPRLQSVAVLTTGTPAALRATSARSATSGIAP